MGKAAIVLLAAVILLAGCSGSTAPSSSAKTSKAPSSHHATSHPAVTQGPEETTTSTSDEPSSDPSDPSADPTQPVTPPDNGTVAPKAAPHVWPSIDAAKIRPGVQTYTSGGQCTANFVFLSADNQTVYIGQAAHCASKGGSTDTNGCQTDSMPIGTAVEVDGTDGRAYKGHLAYSSWLQMHAVQEHDGDTCAYNDWALVQLDDAAAAVTHPAMLHYGGPVAMADPTKLGTGDKVLTYGNSGLRMGVTQTSPKEGWILSPPGSGWTMDIYTVSPGVPGDSGSGVLTTDGAALADLVTLSLDTTNGATILARAVNYANTVGGMDIHLATWAQLDAGLLPPI